MSWGDLYVSDCCCQVHSTVQSCCGASVVIVLYESIVLLKFILCEELRVVNWYGI